MKLGVVGDLGRIVVFDEDAIWSLEKKSDSIQFEVPLENEVPPTNRQ